MEGVYSDEEYSKAYAELLIILKNIPREHLIKVPRDLIHFYIEKMDRNHKFTYDTNLQLNEQNIMHLTIILFSNLYLEYWATDERRKEVEEQDRVELLRLEAKKQEIYNVDNLFKNKQNETTINEPEETGLIIVEKKNIFLRIVEKVKKVLKLT